MFGIARATRPGVATPEARFRKLAGFLAALAVCLLLASPALATPPASGLVYCFDASRNLVHRVRPKACQGRVVSAEAAEKLEERIRQERLDRALQGRNPRNQKKGHGDRSGSGVLVTNDGHVVTARHVVDGCGAVTVHHPSGRQNAARVIGLHETADLALLQTELDRQPKIVLAPSTPLKKGAVLAAVGYPNMGRTAIRPLRSEARFAAKGVVGDKNLNPASRIIFEGELRAGNSGGALVDGRDRLVGVVVAQVDTPAVFKMTGRLVQHVGIAEPLAALRELFEEAGVAIPSSSGGSESNRAEGAVYRITCSGKN